MNIIKEELIKDCAIQLYVWGVSSNEFNFSDEKIIESAIIRAKKFADVYERIIDK